MHNCAKSTYMSMYGGRILHKCSHFLSRIQTVTNVINKHERRAVLIESLTLFQNTCASETKRISTPFDPQINKSLSRTYHKWGYELVNSNEYTLQKKLKSTKDDIPALLCSGIYEIGCQDGCPYRYDGMTQRSPTVRFGEHAECIRKGDLRRHMIENLHSTDISKLKMIEKVSSKNKKVFECVEKMHIVKNMNNGQSLMNLDEGNVQSILFDLVTT